MHQGSTAPVPLPGLIFGLQPEKLTTDILRIFPGTCATADGREILSAAKAMDIDIRRVGSLGRDRSEPLANGRDYFIYLIRKATTRELSAVVSSAITYGQVHVPDGYRMVRKLRFGFVYNERWDGVPNFHLAHWPAPLVTFTDFSDNAKWDALTDGADSAFTSISLREFLPDNARLARVQAIVTGGATGGKAFVRSYGGQANGLLAGFVGPGREGASIQVFDIRVSSARWLEYRVTGDARLTLKIMGYSMTEPS
jgi:hypothetical protein